MRTYLIQYLFENGNVQKQAYFRTKTPKAALEQFREKINLPNEYVVGYKSGKRTTTFRTPYTWYVVIDVTPTPKELADALYQITKTYTDGTCYKTANPYSKPHVSHALTILALYSGTANYLDALETMEKNGHVYKFKNA